MTIRLTKEQKIQISGSNDVFKIMQHILLRENKLARKKEHFWVVCLNPAQEIILIELVSLGSVNKLNLSATDVYSFALQKGSTKIVMVHNHPSNSLKPSVSDKNITEYMIAVGKFLNVPVIDHLIVSEEGYYSFADTGLLKKIEDESPIDLTFENVDRLKENVDRLNNEVSKREKEMATIKKENQKLKQRLAGGLPKATPAKKTTGSKK